MSEAHPGGGAGGALRHESGAAAFGVADWPEHFQEKWNPVFRPKMRQCKNARAVSAPGLCETALCLAAAPTFAVMALLTGVLGGGAPNMLCAAAQDGSPLSGMVPMYLLMSAFHSAPWLKLILQAIICEQKRNKIAN